MMEDTLYLTAYRAALSELARNVELTSDEWPNIPPLLRNHLAALIAAGKADRDEIVSALVSHVRQSEQIKRSARNLGF
jgi:hypothetical protein